MMATTSMALLIGVVIATGCSPTRLGPPLRDDRTAPIREVLANGIPVIIEERPSSEVVALQLWVKVGARDESPSELGLAHYLEHMVFKGTATRGPGFVDRDVERAGGRINAGTSLDYTYYHVLLPTHQVVAGIEMLADVSVNASLDEGLLGHEKSVVLEEMRLRDDNPRDRLARRLYTLVFEGHVYGRPMIGRPEAIRNVSREMLVGFYRRHYVTESFALVVAGTVKPDEVLRAAARTFGRLPRTGLSRLPPPLPAALRPVREHVDRAGSELHLGMAWPGPRLDHADMPAVDLLVGILGRSRAARLTQSLRERRGLVNAIAMSYTPLEAAGIVTLVAQLDPAKAHDAESAVHDELRRVRDEGVTDAELRRAVTAVEARREFAAETAEGRAYALGRAVILWRIAEELAYVDRVRSVTMEQVRTAARQYLGPERYARVTLGPPAR